MTLTLADVYLGLGGRQLHPILASVPISQFVIDSRQVTPGSCFVALPGEHTDGHRFIGDAIDRGAIAIIAERLVEQAGLAPEERLKSLLPGAGLRTQALQPNLQPAPAQVDRPLLFLVESSLEGLQRVAARWRTRHHPLVVAITGSVGKTSTKELVAAVLRQRSPTLWSAGNLNNEIGLPLTLLRLEQKHRFAVLEMGFYVEGEIAQLCELARPSLGVITNIGPIHLERAGSMEAIFRGKAELVRALPPNGWAILNWDDDWVRKMAEFSPAPVFRYGLTPEADLWADQIESEGLEGIRFRFHHRQETGKDEALHVHLPLLGRHAVHTALRAAAVGLVCGMGWEDIIHGLRDVSAQLRIEVAPGWNGSTLIDDTYNASPPSTLAALNLLADLGGRGGYTGRRVAVLGDMLELGSFAESGHRMVGARAADVVHMLVTIGPLSAWIGQEALASGLPADQLHHVDSASEALPLLRTLIHAGDYVLIKGSRAMGMEDLAAGLTVNS